MCTGSYEYKTLGGEGAGLQIRDSNFLLRTFFCDGSSAVSLSSVPNIDRLLLFV